MWDDSHNCRWDATPKPSRRWVDSSLRSFGMVTSKQRFRHWVVTCLALCIVTPGVVTETGKQEESLLSAAKKEDGFIVSSLSHAAPDPWALVRLEQDQHGGAEGAWRHGRQLQVQPKRCIYCGYRGRQGLWFQKTLAIVKSVPVLTPA